MRIAIISDAWSPQVNGVVTTLRTTADMLAARGHTVRVYSPDLFHSIPCPTYPQIRLAILPRRKLSRLLDDFQPHAVHVATEGPVGSAGRAWCRTRRLPFTTSYHTKFPEYIQMRTGMPTGPTYAMMRRFHAAAVRTMVATPTMKRDLEARGFQSLAYWSRGVRTDVFTPEDPIALDLPRPIFTYMGRVAIEKNIEAFLRLDLPGSKLVIGDGPDREKLQAAHPAATFVGMRSGRDLARHIAAGDVFVFPSKTDTFGIAMIEAMACGLPVAAFPVPACASRLFLFLLVDE
jgi:glycosyltransferase involved in cell wall biosynthesis